jgi:hypothetical protein
MESCREYADIQVMWKMIESSSPQQSCKKKKIIKSSYWIICFRPTWFFFCHQQNGPIFPSWTSPSLKNDS